MGRAREKFKRAGMMSLKEKRALLERRRIAAGTQKAHEEKQARKKAETKAEEARERATKEKGIAAGRAALAESKRLDAASAAHQAQAKAEYDAKREAEAKKVAEAAAKKAAAAKKPTTRHIMPYPYPSKKPAEKPKGMKNVYEVMKIALNPFSIEKIKANTKSKVFNTAIEYVANAPYLTALMLTGAGGLVKGLVTKGAAKAAVGTAGAFTIGGTVGTVGTTAKIAINTKTAAQSASMLAKVAAQMKKPAYVLAATGAMIGTYPWAEWSQTEAEEVIGFSVSAALKSGDAEIIKLAQEQQEELLEEEWWEKIGRFIPGANIAVGFNKKFKALKAQQAVNKKIMADEIIKIETGETEEDKWERIKTEQKEQDKVAVDYYNDERKKLLKWEEEARDRDMKEDAAFWAKNAAEQRKLEAEDRKAIADFWSAYRKQKHKFDIDNRPSNLNFGLL